MVVRKRGGQLGNTNAKKHGFYSVKFTASESQDLEAALSEGVGDEVTLLRVGIRRLFELAGKSADAGEWASMLDAIGMASVRIAGLLKTQRLIEGGQSSLSDALSQALNEVCNDVSCK